MSFIKANSAYKSLTRKGFYDTFALVETWFLIHSFSGVETVRTAFSGAETGSGMINRSHIKILLKHFIVRSLLFVLRGLIIVKRYGGPVLKTVIFPVVVVGSFLMRNVGVPMYRGFFLIKHHLSRVVLPAKNKILYLISNRYAIHVAVIAIATVTSGINLGNSEVRAETFGENSILYSLVSEDDSMVISVVTASEQIASGHQSYTYMDDPAIDVNAHLDFNYLGESYVTPNVGVNGIAVTPVQDEKIISTRTSVESYVVQEADTLWKIAEKFGLNLSSVLWANQLTIKSVIRPGQALVIPPIDGVLYTVKKGDTISRISQQYGSDKDKILVFNQLPNVDALKVGERLILPDGEPPAAPTRLAAPVGSLFKDSSGVANKGLAAGKGNWVWPATWRVITQYYGWRHTGLDIDGDYSTYSLTARDGVVVYSGWRSGYGLTVEIDHGDGFKTRYAHNSKILVSVGDIVTAGQKIAVTGTTGRSTGTHLHFEVIKNGKFQNPLDYIR